ncbi:hypothetical protein AB833_09570 [Chromatiales bacterium (ex Bugula neritina AB1)]|nr:hypothetical protein AB833_09570 [Chromatiales bacterium (ex Bugula neritina AB1)]
MARPQRIEYEGAYYHVMNRGRGRQNVFHGSKYYEVFLLCLEQANKRFGVEINAYCLMGNHYHLLIHTPRGNLGRAMRHVNGVYTQYYNRMKKTDGPLFRGRYKAINIEVSSYLLEVSRYIHRNPVETKKPLVERLEEYQWSSYPAYRNHIDTPEWLNKETVFGELGSGQPTRSYARYVDHGVDEETERFYSKDNWPVVRGSKEFVENAHRHALSEGREVKRVRSVVPFERVVKIVCEHYDCTEAEVLKSKRGRQERNISRWMAMKLTQENTGMTLLELAKRFQVGSYSAISTTVGKLNKLMGSDRNILAEYELLRSEIAEK